MINDCSTDRSAEIVANYQDPRIRVFHLDKNSGAGAAMNHGIDLSRGEYIYIVDSDDAIMPETLQTLLDTAQNFNADIIHMAAYYSSIEENFDAGANLTVEQDFTIGLQSSSAIDRVQRLGFGMFFPAWLNLYRGNFLRDRKIRFPEFRDGSYDVFFTIAILCTANRFVKIDQPMYVYRSQSRDSFTNSSNEITINRFLSSLQIMLKYLRNLFERDDLIESIPHELQSELTVRLISMIFRNEIFFEPDQIAQIIHQLSMQPEFHSCEFIEDFLMLFCNSMRFIK